MKTKKIFSNIRVIIMLVFLIMSLVAIFSFDPILHPNQYGKGAAIRNILPDSSASDAGMLNPKPTTPPMSKEKVLELNNEKINTIQDYYSFIEDLKVNQTLQIKTNKDLYKLTVRPLLSITVLNETETKIVPEIVQVNETIDNETVLVNKTINKTITVNKTTSQVIGVEDLGFKVYDAPTTNIRKGLDLQGGTRVLLKPDEKLSSDDMSILLANMNQRLNVYGLSDIVIRTAKDLAGQQYISVEIAGVSEEEVKELLAKQGKFEARIGNNTVFIGGKKDITYVCRSADCSGIDPNRGCSQIQDGWACRFMFSISLSPDAAQRQADFTKDLSVETQGNDQYLNESLVLFLDDVQVDTLRISAGLKGRATTEIAISGSGAGSTQQEAVYNSLENMKRLQTILITGSLPVKLNIEKTDALSPLLGKELLKNAIFVGLLSILAVSLVVFIRYKKLQITLPVIFTMLSEVIILLGVSSIIGWNIDLAAIAAIIIAVGTGVDDQIVIVDETLKGEIEHAYSWKQKLKRAFFIIMAAYFTTVVAMLPLWFAGAGILKGFAVITIIGISIGVFITRPAFASIVEILLRE